MYMSKTLCENYGKNTLSKKYLFIIDENIEHFIHVSYTNLFPQYKSLEPTQSWHLILPPFIYEM